MEQLEDRLAPATLYWDANGASAGTGGTGTWDTTSTVWRLGSNAGTLQSWVDGSDAVFEGTAGTVSIAASGVKAASIAFQTTAYVVQNNTLTLTGAASISTSAATATINSTISGTQGLTKLGTGTLVLSSASSDYTGTTSILAGALRAAASVSSGGNGPLGSSTGGAILVGNPLTALDAELITTNFDRDIIVQPGSGNRTITSWGVFGTYASSVVLGKTALFRAYDASGGTAGGLTMTGQISGPGGVTFGNGDMLLTNSDNSYTGVTTILAGSLSISNANVFVTGNSVVGNAASGALVIGGGSSKASLIVAVGSIFTRDITVASGTGVKSLSGSTTRLTGKINLLGTLTFNGGTTYVDGLISGPGNIIVAVSGAVQLTNSVNSYTGSTTISSGSLNVTSDGALGAVPASPTPGMLVIGANAYLTPETTFTLHRNRGIALGPSSGTGTAYLNIVSGTTMSYGGIITNNGAGTGSLRIGSNGAFGVGTLVLSGQSTYTGSTILDNYGVIQVDADVPASGPGPLGNSTSAISIQGGSSNLQLGVSGVTFGRSISITAGNDPTAIRGFGLAPGVLSGAFSGNISVVSGFPKFITAPNGVLTVSGIISGNTGINDLNNILSFAGAGTVVLTGANKFNGPLLIRDSVTLSVSSIGNYSGSPTPSNLGAPTSSVNAQINFFNYEGEGRLLYTGAGETTNRSMGCYLNGFNMSDAVIDSSGSGPLIFSASTFTAAPIRNFALTGSAGGSILGVISQAPFIQMMGSAWIFAGANTFTGSLGILKGSLQFTGPNNVIPNTVWPLVTVAGGVLDMADRNETVPSVVLKSGSIIGTSGVLSSTAGFAIHSGTIGALLGGALTKSTLGTAILNSPTNYNSATSVTGGFLIVASGANVSSTTSVAVSGTSTLIVNGAMKSTSATATFATGSTLAGVGVLTANPSINSGATLAPGADISTTGILSIVGNLSLAGRYYVEINGGAVPAAGIDYDRTNVTGTVNLTGSQLVLSGSRTNEASGSVIVLIKNDAADAITGTFAGLGEGAIVSLNGRLYSISYVYNAEIGAVGGGNDVALTSLASFDYYWDADGDATAATGGAGTWDASSMVWRAGSPLGTLVSWSQATTNTAGTARAVFQGAGGAVVVSAMTSMFLSFDTAGYTLSGTLTLAAASGTINVADGVSATVNATIGGTRLAKLGAGTLVLGGSNTYTGGTTLVAGILQVGADASLGAAPGSATPGNLIFHDGVLATTATFTLNANRGLAFEPTSAIATATFNVLSGTTLTYAGIAANFVAGSSGGLTKSGNGALALTGVSNTYSGPTNIVAGKLIFSNDGSFGSAPSTPTPSSIIINGGATLEYGGATASVTLNSNRGIALGPNTGAGSATVNIPSLTLIISGIIANNGTGTGHLVKTGLGVLAITGDNTYSGSTTVLAGSLDIASDSNLGLAPTSPTPGSIVLSSTLHVTASMTLNANRGIALGTIAANGTGTIQVMDNTTAGTLIYDGIMTNNGGTGHFAKSGGMGTLVLSGMSTYTGKTFINGGTIQLNANVPASGNGPLGNSASAIQFGTTAAMGLTIGADNIIVSRDLDFPYAGPAAPKSLGLASGVAAGTFAGNASLGGGSGRVTFNAGTGVLTLSGILSSGPYLNRAAGDGSGFDVASGTVVVTNSANTFAGDINVSAATLQPTVNNALGSTAGAVILSNTGTLLFENGLHYTTNEYVSAAGKVVSRSGNNRFDGSISAADTKTSIASDTLGDTFTLGGALLTSNTYSLKFSGVGDIFQDSMSVISGNGGITKTLYYTSGVIDDAFGGTLTLTGMNTYSGQTNIFAGVLSVASLGNFGSSSPSNLGKPSTDFYGRIGIGGIGEAMGKALVGTLRYTGTGETTNRGILLGAATAGGGHSIIDHAGTGLLKFTGNVESHTSFRILTLQGSAGSIGELSGAFPGPANSNVLNLNKLGSGTWKLSGTNSYTGTTAVKAGVLQYSSPLSLYNNTPANWTPAKIPGASGATLAFNVGGPGEFSAADIDIVKSILVNGGTVLGLDTSNAAGSFFYNSAIANTNSGNNFIGLAKFGANALSLGGANTYTGPTSIFAGAIAINGSLSPSSTLFALNSGQTLAGSGQINRSVAINPGATLAPGNSIGTLSVNNNLALAGVSSFEVTGGSGPFASADKAANIAALTYGGTLKIIKLGGTLAAGDSWDLFDFASQSGTFANHSVFETAGDGVNLPALGPKLIWQFNYACCPASSMSS